MVRVAFRHALVIVSTINKIKNLNKNIPLYILEPLHYYKK